MPKIRRPKIATPTSRAAELLELWLRLDEKMETSGVDTAAITSLRRRTLKLISELRRG